MFRNTIICLLAITATLPAAAGAQSNISPVPLSLKTAVETALASNLNLTLRQEDTAIAAGAIDIARSRFDKQFTAEAGVEGSNSTPLFVGGSEDENGGRLNAAVTKRFTTGTEVEVGVTNSRFDSDAQGLQLNPSYNSSVELGISQPLLRGWGKDIQTGQVTAAEIDYSAATFQVDSTAADLAALVKRGYWELVFTWQDIEVKQFSVTLARKLLEETTTKIAAGSLAEVEVYQPQSEVTRREEDLIAAERAIGVAEDELKLLLNSSDWLSPFSPTDLPRTEPVQLEPEKILATALSNRPDLKAAKITVDAASIRQSLAEDDLRPSLDLTGRSGTAVSMRATATRWQRRQTSRTPAGRSRSSSPYHSTILQPGDHCSRHARSTTRRKPVHSCCSYRLPKAFGPQSAMWNSPSKPWKQPEKPVSPP